jgi:uncharacterized protein YqgC (DUF456 family)
MGWLALLVGVLVALLGVASVFLVLVGLPGTWLLLGLVLLIELIDGWWLVGEPAVTFAWWLLIACLGLAVVGEVLELVAGALGAKRGGASRRGMVFAAVGGIVGGIAGAPFGLVLGAFAGAVIGTFAGAVVGELGNPNTALGDTLRPATAASIGRILGTLVKLPIAIAVAVALSVAAFVP